MASGSMSINEFPDLFMRVQEWNEKYPVEEFPDQRNRHLCLVINNMKYRGVSHRIMRRAFHLAGYDVACHSDICNEHALSVAKYACREANAKYHHLVFYVISDGMCGEIADIYPRKMKISNFLDVFNPIRLRKWESETLIFDSNQHFTKQFDHNGDEISSAHEEELRFSKVMESEGRETQTLVLGCKPGEIIGYHTINDEKMTYFMWAFTYCLMSRVEDPSSTVTQTIVSMYRYPPPDSRRESRVNMSDSDKEEGETLQKEFKWLLALEVPAGLRQLQGIIIECARRFNIPNIGIDTLVRSEKFIMCTANQASSEQIKCVVTLMGDNIAQADINLKVHKNSNQVQRTKVQSDNPWKLQQIQDAGNHLYSALQHIRNIEKDYQFQAADEVIHLLTEIMECLKRGLNCLIVPKKRTIEELQNSANVRNLQPLLPPDLAVSFYIQSHKLIFAVYCLQLHHGSTKFDVYQSECSVPWLNEVLVLFSMALQLCQQLKGKVDVFSQYGDLNFECPRAL